ncbi:hypothetical protein BZA77DRAFT_294510 [Pyronema omphalodes]|nr:hypothetical protein BZA77DRAFT_298467 [Pyronema omphalodes]KAI5815093.1 hypothetical protein BZA77DRAFT_294510 [Pyronema omphalodes]
MPLDVDNRHYNIQPSSNYVIQIPIQTPSSSPRKHDEVATLSCLLRRHPIFQLLSQRSENGNRNGVNNQLLINGPSVRIEDIRAAVEMGNVVLYDFSVSYHPTMEYGIPPVSESTMSL